MCQKKRNNRRLLGSRLGRVQVRWCRINRKQMVSESRFIWSLNSASFSQTVHTFSLVTRCRYAPGPKRYRGVPWWTSRAPGGGWRWCKSSWSRGGPCAAPWTPPRAGSSGAGRARRPPGRPGRRRCRRGTRPSLRGGGARQRQLSGQFDGVVTKGRGGDLSYTLCSSKKNVEKKDVHTTDNRTPCASVLTYIPCKFAYIPLFHAFSPHVQTDATFLYLFCSPYSSLSFLPEYSRRRFFLERW